MSGDVVDINKHAPHFAVMAMCMLCHKRWIGVVNPKAKLFQLECPHCGECDSFVSFVPNAYLEEHA